MPDHSFPEVNPPDGGNTSIQSFLHVEEKNTFAPMVDSSQESWPQLLHEHQPEANAFIKPLTFHADPLTPLRLRDELALDEVFDNGYHMEEVLSDIRARLGQLCPEPCWDDESFNFLRGYL